MNTALGFVFKTLFSSKLMNGPNELDYYITLNWKSLPGANTVAYWTHSFVKKKMNLIEYSPGWEFTRLFFSSQLTNGPNKLQYYITLGLKSFLITNTLAHWAQSLVMKKMNLSEYGPGSVFTRHFFSTYGWDQ